MKTESDLVKPNNQYQQALFYLYYWENFSLGDLIKDSFFYKFQSRLSEIENKEMSLIATRERKSFTNRFGNNSTFNIYNRCISKEKIKELFDKYS